MGLIRWLKEKESRLPWSIVGALLGALSLFLGAWALKDKRPQLQISVVGDANVLDINARVAELEVRFQGQDIQALEQNLRVVSVQLANIGDVPITQGSYDLESLWGLRFENSRVVEARVVRHNDAYLADRLDPRVQSDSVVLGRPIIERGSFVVVEAVMLQRRGEPLQISPFGKIAGIRDIEVALAPPAVESPPVLREATSGRAIVQLVRLIVYSLGALTLLAVVVALASSISSASDTRERQRRRKRIELFVAQPGPHPGIRAFLGDLYVREGLGGVSRLNALLADTTMLRREVSRARSLLRHSRPDPTLEHFERARVSIEPPLTTLAKDLLTSKLVLRTHEGEVAVAEGLPEALRELLAIVDPTGTSTHVQGTEVRSRAGA